MANLSAVRIPKDGVPVLQRVAQLGDDVANALIEALSSDQIRSISAVVAAVTGVVKDQWSEDEVAAFVGNLVSMSTLGTSHDYPPDELAGKISELVGQSLDEDEKKQLPGRLTALLSARSFRAFSKAIDVSRETDRVLNVSRILSDVRPVFGQDAAEDPLGALVVHTLRIDYYEQGEVKTDSFTLNAKDLEQLKDAIERAEEKERTLSRILKRAELAEFNLSGDSDD
ncbi:hypothetical protein [Mycobacterium paragordonae]|uniref:Uncharacterized protein n=1 Tax=Mycobacterium paragordonae TaxID=1389713 RepID=A0AAJ1W6P9_9MYCO|nr:hypothetical protein [Mycobacterium paragordonae]MDP7738996.1 hypothetical protein [Mycobacterium paragordonae]TDK97426.1 hypothetical protein EUA05_31830 [Mycobacterium paragordonae]